MIERSGKSLGVLLAGGQSRRMGHGDKCLNHLAGRPLLAHAIERLRPQVSDIVLNANGAPERFARFGLDVVPDTIAGHAGPLAGILAGMLWARRNCPDIVFVATAATDSPFFPRNMVQALAAVIDGGHEIAFARCGNRDYPVFGLFPVVLAADLDEYLQMSENRAVMAWLDRHHAVPVDFEPASDSTIDPFFNVNTPADLAAAEGALTGT